MLQSRSSRVRAIIEEQEAIKKEAERKLDLLYTEESVSAIHHALSDSLTHSHIRF